MSVLRLSYSHSINIPTFRILSRSLEITSRYKRVCEHFRANSAARNSPAELCRRVLSRRMRNVRENFHETESCTESLCKGTRWDEIRRDLRSRDNVTNPPPLLASFLLFTIFTRFFTNTFTICLLYIYYIFAIFSANDFNIGYILRYCYIDYTTIYVNRRESRRERGPECA